MTAARRTAGRQDEVGVVTQSTPLKQCSLRCSAASERDRDLELPATGLIWSLSSRSARVLIGKRSGVMRHKSAAATMDQTDIRGLVTTVHRSVMEAASL